MNVIGNSIIRKESWDKVTGKTKYTDDYSTLDMLYAALLPSTYAHAEILSIDTSKASSIEGVVSVITGDYFKVLCGPVLSDRPPIARDKVRYYGEPVAMVVALDERTSRQALELINVSYSPLPELLNPEDSIKEGAPLIHQDVSSYTKNTDDVYPEAFTNIANRVKIRKGDIVKGFNESDVIVEQTFSLPQADHIAIENRSAIAEIKSDGTVNIISSTQAPYEVKKQISSVFNIPEGKVIVNAPLLGGGFGGKSAVFLEILAYMASYSAGGRKVKITNTRELDIISAPCRMGLSAKIKMGVDKQGMIKAAEISYLLDNGAYADIGPRIAKAIAVDCTGPYNIPNLYCDSLAVYTNHTFITAYRGFGHDSYTFAIERVIDKLANKLNIDSFKIRQLNAICPDHYSPTQVRLTNSNIGSLSDCLIKLKALIQWDENKVTKVKDNKVRAKGIACLWKTSNTFTNASSGAVLTFNSDGSLNLNCGVVEFGQASKTHLVQILAERMNMNPDRISINYDVNTAISPEHWKTVASMSSYLAGRAVFKAADDLISQLKAVASIALRCPIEDLEVSGEKVYVKHDPYYSIGFQDICFGLKYPDGNCVGHQIIGRGGFVMTHLTTLDTETGKGKTGPEWCVGAQAVEVEYDIVEHTYRILKAATVLDVGKVINPLVDAGVVMGGMSMGLGLGSREEIIYTGACAYNTSLRSYKLIHIGQEPQYLVDFVETKNIESPYGTRGFSEHGVLAIHAALANALSSASGLELDSIPINPEKIWNIKSGANL